MSYREMKITIELPFTLSAKTGVDSCLCDEQSALKTVAGWEDGRYAFPVEMLAEAVKDIVEEVARISVLRLMKLKHGSEFVEDGHGGKHQRCYAELDKWMREDYGGCHPRLDDIKMKIEKADNPE